MSLWNASVLSAEYRPGKAAYQVALVEQWKMLVETSERVGTRRSLANTFFLAVNAMAITVLGVFWESHPTGVSVWWLLLPLTILLLMCVAWWVLVGSYRRLNAAKFDIIHRLEDHLPAKVFVEEWRMLQRAEGSSYVPLTVVERVVPLLFAVTYISGGALAIATST